VTAIGTRPSPVVPQRSGGVPERSAGVLEHRSLPETVRMELRRRILNAELPAGTRLVETSLATELGVSRATIREAVRELANEGLVQIAPRRFSVVTRMSAADAMDVCYARAALEVAALRVLDRPRRADLEAPMTATLVLMDAAAADGDLRAIVDLDTEFHGLVVRASGLRRLGELWAAMNSQMGGLIRASIDRQGMALAETAARHEPLRDAIVHGTARQVERAVYDHYVPDAPLWPEPDPGAAGAGSGAAAGPDGE
jgi:DNA-binding GntR family transcriptional regulator